MAFSARSPTWYGYQEMTKSCPQNKNNDKIIAFGPVCFEPDYGPQHMAGLGPPNCNRLVATIPKVGHDVWRRHTIRRSPSSPSCLRRRRRVTAEHLLTPSPPSIGRDAHGCGSGTSCNDTAGADWRCTAKVCKRVLVCKGLVCEVMHMQRSSCEVARGPDKNYFFYHHLLVH